MHRTTEENDLRRRAIRYSRKLSELSGQPVSPEGYYDWFDGGDSSDVCDRAMRAVFGPLAMKVMEELLHTHIQRFIELFLESPQPYTDLPKDLIGKDHEYYSCFLHLVRHHRAILAARS